MSSGKLSSSKIDEATLNKVVGGAFTQGSEGADTLAGTAEADVIFGQGGHDVIGTGQGDDQGYGGEGNDFIHTGAGNDLAFGGAGQDTLNGGSGADQLQGEEGNDFLDGGAHDGAADLAFGGAGDDSFIWAPGDGNDQFQGGEGRDSLSVANMGMEALLGALTVEGSGLQMVVTNNVVTFTDAQGNPATFSGSITVGGETMRFFGIEQIRVG
ncbi:calcium-binding protein [Falsiroseomonas sp.]|uniref:calcium-binding protein n=1 Tax=Falsiroseomonas sp. TaxID=2870721 RepID=UPI003F70663F